MSFSPDDELLRTIVNVARSVAGDTVSEALRRARVSTAIPGIVEDVDSDRDVVYVRNDDAVDAVDLYRGVGEMPGIAAMTRQGNTLTGEQVRAFFDGSAGGTATNTGVEARITLPYGATSGKRIIIDGELGIIAFFDEDDVLVGVLETDQWAMGAIDPPGARGTFDPIGGFRMRAVNDALVMILDQNGLTLRDPITGQTTTEIQQGRISVIDPAGVDTIEMVTSPAGTLPKPSYRAAAEVNPGGSLVAPSAPRFTSAPADDLELAHVAAWIRAGSFPSATMTPPAGWTEQLDSVFADPAGTLHSSIATRHPAPTPAAVTFTDSLTGWQHAIGSRVIIRGGGAVSPSFRSVATAQYLTTAGTITATVAKPAGLAVGDALIAFVSLGVSGGSVPTGWVTPPGFELSGAVPSLSGSGATQSTLATGVWTKVANADDVAATDFETTINLPAGTKMLEVALVAVQGPFLVPGGVQIRVGGKPIRRVLRQNILQADSANLCDFGGPSDPLGPIPQAYDHLELVYDASSTAGATRGVAIRFNGDTTATRYYDRRVDNGVDFGQNFQANGHIFVAQMAGASAGAKASGNIDIYGYASSPRPNTSGQAWHSDALVLHGWNHWGQYDRVNPIERVELLIPTAGGVIFQAGSRATLYGY